MKVCECCGAKMVEYTFTFNKGLAACLSKIAKHEGKFVEIKTLGLTSSQWTNFQKLRYWDLIEKPAVDDTGGKGGVWRITEKGVWVVMGFESVKSKVVMYRNRRVRFEGNPVYFSDVFEGYEYRGDYIEQINNQGAKHEHS